MKKLFVVALVGLGLALSGCGGSGSGEPVEVHTPPPGGETIIDPATGKPLDPATGLPQESP